MNKSEPFLTKVKVGDRVGAGRWPYSHAHPDCWGKPWAGVVLSETDPRAWANTLAFPVSSPDPAAVKEHVAECKSMGSVVGNDKSLQ